MDVTAPGTLRVGRLRGVPVLVHWSAVLGAVFASRFAWAPGVWVGFALLVLIHEAGHAVLVRAVGARALAIVLHGLGGECHWQGAVSPMGRALIAWGGVAAQAVLLAATEGALALLGPPSDRFVAEVVVAFTRVNVWLIALNLFPMRPLDGAEAWRIVPLIRARFAAWSARRARDRARVQATRAAAREVAELDALDGGARAPGGAPEPLGATGANADDAARALWTKLEERGVVAPGVDEPGDD